MYKPESNCAFKFYAPTKIVVIFNHFETEVDRLSADKLIESGLKISLITIYIHLYAVATKNAKCNYAIAKIRLSEQPN